MEFRRGDVLVGHLPLGFVDDVPVDEPANANRAGAGASRDHREIDRVAGREARRERADGLVGVQRFPELQGRDVKGLTGSAAGDASASPATERIQP